MTLVATMRRVGERGMTLVEIMGRAGRRMTLVATMRRAGQRGMTLVATMGRVGERGMTLVEIMVVVVIMAVIATGVSIYVIPKITEARIDASKTDLNSIRTALELHTIRNPGECAVNGPLDEAAADRLGLKKSQRSRDPWDNEYIVRCEPGMEPEVLSKGPDGEEGTEDDIR